jgi:hypothetical protein
MIAIVLKGEWARVSLTWWGRRRLDGRNADHKFDELMLEPLDIDLD